MMSVIGLFVVLLAVAFFNSSVHTVQGWSPTSNNKYNNRLSSSSSVSLCSASKRTIVVPSSDHNDSTSLSHQSTTTTINNNHRRELFKNTFLGIAGLGTTTVVGNSITNIQPANAAASVPTKEELSKLQKGYSRIRYLLDNWKSITEPNCGSKIMSDTERKQVIRTEGGGGGVCDKDPLKVQEYMGYKSTNDPLYKADKLMIRAAPLVDADNYEDYLEVVEKYRERADQTAMMAYTSSWGEANPNGSKEVIDDYLLKTKAEVEESEKLLKSALMYLQLDILPPSP